MVGISLYLTLAGEQTSYVGPLNVAPAILKNEVKVVLQIGIKHFFAFELPKFR
jgi:hypothetical protein